MPFQDTVNQIAIRIEELDQLRPISPEQERRIMDKFRLDWNFHSNNIEGNQLSYGETKSLLMHGITANGKPLKDQIEIKGHNEALLYLEEVIRQKRPLTENFIREMHEMILKEPYEVDTITPDGQATKRLVKIGQYKTSPNHVLTKTKEIFRFAGPEETPALMTDLVNWLRTELENPQSSALLLAAEFHYRFIRIHPFDDGNGRLARILMNFILMMKGYPPVIIKTDKKTEYFNALQSADGGNLEAFFEYIGVELLHSIDIMIKGAKGENIEDSDDIDKEIALFKAQLNKDDVLQISKSNSAIVSLCKNSFSSLFELIHNKLSQFDELFLEKRENYSFNNSHATYGKNNQYNEFILLLKQLDEQTNPHQLDSIDSINSIQCQVIWKGYKKRSNNNAITLNLWVNISFNPIGYSIECQGSNKSSAYEVFTPISNNEVFKPISRFYHQQLGASEISIIANSTAKFILEQIKAISN